MLLTFCANVDAKFCDDIMDREVSNNGSYFMIIAYCGNTVLRVY